MVNADLVGDDLWLAQNLIQYRPEPSWPLHLKVEREMKGWGDSGGKGKVFDLLRAAGAQPGDANLTASLNRVFAAGSDDLRLATSRASSRRRSPAATRARFRSS
jgi:hypothetical protein